MVDAIRLPLGNITGLVNRVKGRFTFHNRTKSGTNTSSVALGMLPETGVTVGVKLPPPPLPFCDAGEGVTEDEAPGVVKGVASETNVDVGVLDGVKVGVTVGGSGVGVNVAVLVGGIGVRVAVGWAESVFVGEGVNVAVCVGVLVAVLVAVCNGVSVGVLDGVNVKVAVAVGVLVSVWVAVWVAVGVCVSVGVGVGVSVGVGVGVSDGVGVCVGTGL